MPGNLGNFPDTIVYMTKVPYLCAQILNKKSAFSPATVVFEKKKTNTNQQRIGCLVYPVITQIVNGPVEIMEELE